MDVFGLLGESRTTAVELHRGKMAVKQRLQKASF